MKRERFEIMFSNEDDTYDEPNATGSPERRLILAVLERAMLDLAGNNRKDSEEAEAWIFNPPTETPYPEFSFPWVCEQLDLDQTEISKQIKAMPKRGESRLAPWYLMRSEIKEAA